MTDPQGFWGHRPMEEGALVSAHRPWLDPDRPMEPYRGAEPQADIDRRLGCAIPAKWCKGQGTGCVGRETRGAKKKAR